jgi:hypothetical protein
LTKPPESGGHACSRSTPLASRISAPGNLVRVECAACGHDTLIPQSALLQGLHLALTTRVLDLESRLRCRECDVRGRAILSIRWSDAK